MLLSYYNPNRLSIIKYGEESGDNRRKVNNSDNCRAGGSIMTKTLENTGIEDLESISQCNFLLSDEYHVVDFPFFANFQCVVIHSGRDIHALRVFPIP